MAKARETRRVLLTLDKHFANLLNYPPGTHPGIILIRIHPPLAQDITPALHHFLSLSPSIKFDGCLIVLETEGFRIRRPGPVGERDIAERS